MRIYAVDEDTLYFSSTSGNFRRSTDGGATWTTVSTGQAEHFMTWNLQIL